MSRDTSQTPCGRARPSTPSDATGTLRATRREAHPLVHALLHRGRMGPVREAALEARQVEPDLLGVRLELLGAELGRVGEERVMIVPELPLILGAPRRLGCFPGLGMETVDREVSEHQLHLLAVP